MLSIFTINGKRIGPLFNEGMNFARFYYFSRGGDGVVKPEYDIFYR